MGDDDHRGYVPPHMRKLKLVQTLLPNQRPTRSELIAIIAYEWGYKVSQQSKIFSQSEKTVRTHLQKAHEKVYAANATEAIWLIERCEWLDVDLRADIEKEINSYVRNWEAQL